MNREVNHKIVSIKTSKKNQNVKFIEECAEIIWSNEQAYFNTMEFSMVTHSLILTFHIVYICYSSYNYSIMLKNI